MPSVNLLLEQILAAQEGGGGSGTNGFIDYNDTSTTASPVTLSADTWTALPNDGLGAFTNKAYAPSGVTELMDISTGKIDPTELPLGSTILIRNDFTVTLDSGSGIGYRRSLVPDMIYMGDTNTRDYHIGLEVRLSAGGTLVNAGSAIQVIKQ